MLEIIIPKSEMFNENTNEFINIEETKLYLEHSLISISKWEAKWKRTFLDTTKEKNADEILDYIKCMTMNKHIDDVVYKGLTNENVQQILEYIKDPMSATQFVETQSDKYGPRSHDKPTSEFIYYLMITYNIPVEFEKWHLNRLLKLIKVCEIKNGNGKKMSRNQIMSRNQAINEARRKKYNTKG